jgi:AraC-like DNA-binding protein
MARAHLEEGRASVTEIAFLLGFADTSSFSRAFRRWTGQSPRAYTQHQTCDRSKASGIDPKEALIRVPIVALRTKSGAGGKVL